MNSYRFQNQPHVTASSVWINVFVPVMTEGLHVHIHRARIGTSSSLEHTTQNKKQIYSGSIFPFPVAGQPLQWGQIVCCTCRQTARFTLEPKAVLTALGDKPTSLKSLEKECERARRGRSSAITTQLRTHDRFTPRACRCTHTGSWWSANIGYIALALTNVSLQSVEKHWKHCAGVMLTFEGLVCKIWLDLCFLYIDKT